MPTGKIKYYNQDKGYGFIAQDDGEDLFFHILKSPSVSGIKAGLRVKYEIGKGKRGLEAENIELILTPFEQRKLSKGKVVISKDTLVWTPDSDMRARRRQAKPKTSQRKEQSSTKSSQARAVTLQREQPTIQSTPPKLSHKPDDDAPSSSVASPSLAALKEELKKPSAPPKRKEIAPARAADFAAGRPSQKPAVEAILIEERKPTVQKVPPSNEVKGKPEDAEKPAPQKKSPKEPQKKRKLTYGDRYMLKQIREKTPMVFEMYNHESILCTVAYTYKYDLDLLLDGGEKRRVQKHNIKYCYKQGNADKVSSCVLFDEAVRCQKLEPIIRRKDRYQIDSNLIKEAKERNWTIRFVTREGEIIIGKIGWYSTYEIKVKLPKGGNAVVFFHAAYDFKVLDKEGTTEKEETSQLIPTVQKTQKEALEAKDEIIAKRVPPSLETHLGEKIRSARQALGMSQKQLAESFGVSSQTIGNWERSRSQPQDKYREQIEKLYAKAQAIATSYPQQSQPANS